MTRNDFIRTKWDVSGWSEDEKRAWQEYMFTLGFEWPGAGKSVSSLDAAHYFINANNWLGFGDSHEQRFFDRRKHKQLWWGDVFSTKEDIKITRKDFRGTKWDVSNWAKQQKLDWQEHMLRLGYRWYSQGYRIGNLDLDYYFIDHNGKLLYSVLRDAFDSDTGKELVYHDVFPEQPESNNGYIVWSPSARTNPKMVHETYEAARKECERLTLKTKQRFHVATLSEPCTVQYQVQWGEDNG